MQKVEFPPIRGGFQINTISSREPPSRSWSRYKKLLIDNPKDSNLLQRQKLWNFQKLNRGAFRSQITSLPDIPYRVKPGPVEKVSVGVQVNLTGRYGRGRGVNFPNLTPRRSTTASPYASNDESDVEYDGPKTERGRPGSPMGEDEDGEYDDDFEDSSSVDDIGLEFESIVKKKNAGTMTLPMKAGRRREKRKRGSRDRERASVKKDNISMLVNTNEVLRASSSKAVSFAPGGVKEDGNIEGAKVNDAADTVPKVEVVSSSQNAREASTLSVTSEGSFLKLPAENVGHSSQLSCDPLSVLDFLSGSRNDRSRMAEATPNKTPRDKSKRRTKPTDPDADRVWFEKIVGDKEIVDVGTYESFARTRPSAESQSDSADRIVDSVTKVQVRKNYTPRINDDFPQYHSVVAKDPNKESKPKPPPPTINKGRGTKRGFIGIGKSY